MKKHLAIILSAALTLSMSACEADTSGNTSNDAEEISAGLDALGEKVGDLLGIESKEEKVLKNPLFKEGLLAVKIDDLWGYIDKSGEFVIEPQFLNAKNFQANGLAIVCGEYDENGESYEGYGIIDKNGNYIVEPKYNRIENFDSNGLAKIAENGRDEILDPDFGNSTRVYDWGLVNEKGEIILEPEYSMISSFDGNGIAKVGVNPKIKKNYISLNTWSEEIIYNCGLINTKGEFIYEISLSNWGIGDFHQGWATVSCMPANYIDINGNLMLDYSDETGIYFSDVYDFTNDGIAHVRNGEGYSEGYIDTNGKPVIDIKYFALGDFAENSLTYAYIFGEKYGFIDKKGNYIIEPQFDKAEDFDYNGYAKVNIGYEFDTVDGILAEGKWGLIDKSGNYVVQPIYDEITEVKYDVAIVRSGDKYGFVNLKKNIAIEPEYDYISFQSNRYVICTTLSGSIYMDFDGNIDSNAENAVCIGDTYVGFIDIDGRVQIDKKCLENIDFSNGARQFYCNGGSGIIDVNGNVIFLQDAYIASEFDTNGIAIINESDNEGRSVYGYIKTNGEYLIEPKYGYATCFFDDNYAIVAEKGIYKIINENGENVFDKQFGQVALE